MSRTELRDEINILRDELNSWLNTSLSNLKTNLIEQSKLCTHTLYMYKLQAVLKYLHTGMGQCDCTSDIKQLLGKMDIIQNSVAASNESYQGKLSLTTTR